MKMFRSWLQFLQRQKRAPEDSATFRAWVGVNVFVALLATAAQLDWPEFFVPCVLLTGFGMVLSHRLRARNNWEVKAALSVLMIVALGNFFVGLARSYYDPREPLAELLMWLQALHSCDLPSRKDLSYSLLSALILMSVAAVLSVQLTFGIYLALYYLTVVTALRWNYRSLVLERTGWAPPVAQHRSSGAGQAGTVLRMGATILLTGTLVVALMPRVQGFRIRALPISWQVGMGLPQVSKGEIRNPYYPPEMSKEEMRRNHTFNPDSYSGFNSIVDLQVRGRLRHERVFQVRTNIPSYFRGAAFDEYDGQFWTQTQKVLKPLSAPNPPFFFFPLTHNPVEIVQIFYIDRPMANLVLFAPQPLQVFFPSQQLFQDRAGCLVSPFVLEKDLVYSVISRQSRPDANRLRRLPNKDIELRRVRNYLQLPENLPPRLRKLARDITKGERSFFGKGVAIATYLQTNYKYTLDVPRYPEGEDVAEYFLFEARQGYCEQFATAMAILCRLNGIPARYCTGYLPGRYNPFTGFREVYGDDAHAWVELFIPGHGWMTFDPTPEGEATPELQSQQTSEERWLGLAIARYLSQQLGVSWQPVAGTLSGLGVLFLLLAARKAWRRKPSGLDPVAECLGQALALPGVERLAGSTPQQVARQNPYEPLQRLVELHESVVYRGQGSSPEQRQQARALVKQLREQLARKKT